MSEQSTNFANRIIAVLKSNGISSCVKDVGDDIVDLEILVEHGASTYRQVLTVPVEKGTDFTWGFIRDQHGHLMDYDAPLLRDVSQTLAYARYVVARAKSDKPVTAKLSTDASTRAGFRQPDSRGDRRSHIAENEGYPLTGTGNDAAAGRWKYVLDAAPIDEIVEALRRRGVVASVWDAAAARPVVEESFRDGETLGEDEVEKISAALIEKAAEALTRVLADAGSMVLLEEWVARRDELLGTEQATGPKF